MEDLAEFMGERTLLRSISPRVLLDDKTMRQGRTTVNQAARRLAELVRSMIFFCFFFFWTLWGRGGAERERSEAVSRVSGAKNWL